MTFASSKIMGPPLSNRAFSAPVTYSRTTREPTASLHEFVEMLALFVTWAEAPDSQMPMQTSANKAVAKSALLPFSVTSHSQHARWTLAISRAAPSNA